MVVKVKLDKNLSLNAIILKLSIKKTALKLSIIAVGIFILSFLIMSAVNIYGYSQCDETRPADVAIILGAGINSNEPTPVFRERINHGIWLYENGYVTSLILTGGYSKNHDISDAMVAQNYAFSKGIPAKAVFIEEKSSITQENLYYAQQIMKELNFKNALIVSDPLHMKRALRLANDLEIEAYSSPTKTSMYKSWHTKAVFLARETFFYLGYEILR